MGEASVDRARIPHPGPLPQVLRERERFQTPTLLGLRTNTRAGLHLMLPAGAYRLAPLLFGLIVLLAFGAAPANAAHGAPLRLSVTLSAQAPHMRGTLDADFRNTSTVPVREVYWLLFANRFTKPDQGINDFNRPFVYPYEEFEAGGTTLSQVQVGEQPLAIRDVSAPGVPDGCVIAVALPAALAPGEVVRLHVEFQTTLPTRFGTFGVFEDTLTAIGGWYPYIANFHTDGSWGLNETPEVTSFDVTANWDTALHVVLNGFELDSNRPQRVDAVHFLSLVADRELLRDEIPTASAQIVYLHRPPQRSDRRAFGPSNDEIMRETLQSIVTHTPDAVAPLPEKIVVVEAPLRLDLTAAGQGMVVISDRALKVHWLLRPFHVAQLAQAIYAEGLRPLLARRESTRDYVWVSEGVSHFLAQEYLRRSQPPARSVQSWIDLFNVFAIVDRFESEPKVPFVSAFFDRTRSADALHQQITTFNRELPPGRVIVSKLKQVLSAEEFDRVLHHCSRAALPFLACAEEVTKRPLQAAIVPWLQPYPEINYEWASTSLRQSQGSEYRNDVVVRRRANREVHEPVDLELRSIGGEPMRLRWDGSGDEGHLQVTSSDPMYQAVIDPDRKLIESTRSDNFSPPAPQVVLDSAEVEVSSTEFGFSGLVVGRDRYDYRKDIAAAGFYTNRSIGVTVGPRYHWGERNDSTLYRHNLYGFYSTQALDRDFKDNRIPSVISSGHSNGLGLRYSYNNVYAFDNPTESIDFRLFGDWYDRSLGSDYNYADWGASVVATHPLWTHRTILAGELTNGFTQPLGSSRVPNQGEFSLGGSRSIRGIGAEDELGRNLFLIRSEVRQTIYPELDLNLLDLLVLRRTQARLFVDTGSVSNSAGAIYDPRHYAVGVGARLALVYEILGLLTTTPNLEAATRVDRGRGDVQFLFGTRQAF